MKQQVYQTNAEYIEAMMKKFKLVDMREQYRDLILEAEASYPAPCCRRRREARQKDGQASQGGML